MFISAFRMMMSLTYSSRYAERGKVIPDSFSGNEFTFASGIPFRRGYLLHGVPGR